MKNEGNVGNLQNFIWGIVSVAITLGVGFAVLEGLQDTLKTTDASTVFNSTHFCSGAVNSTGHCTTGSYSLISQGYTSTGTVISKLGTVPTWIGIIIVVAMAMIVMGYFYFRN